MVTNDLAALLDGLDTAHIHADGRIELQRAAAGGGFRVAEHNADLLTQLVDEDDAAVGLADDTGQLTQCLGHKTCLQAHVGITHLAVNLSLRNQGCNRVHNDNVYRAGAHHGLGDLQCLLTVVRLGNVKVVNIYANVLCVYRVKGVLRIDETGNTATLLHLSYHVERNCGLTTGLRSVDLNDTALRHTAKAQRDIQADGTSRYSFNIHVGAGITEFHDGTFSIGLLNLCDGSVKGF